MQDPVVESPTPPASIPVPSRSLVPLAGKASVPAGATASAVAGRNGAPGSGTQENTAPEGRAVRPANAPFLAQLLGQRHGAGHGARSATARNAVLAYSRTAAFQAATATRGDGDLEKKTLSHPLRR